MIGSESQEFLRLRLRQCMEHHWLPPHDFPHKRKIPIRAEEFSRRRFLAPVSKMFFYSLIPPMADHFQNTYLSGHTAAHHTSRQKDCPIALLKKPDRPSRCLSNRYKQRYGLMANVLSFYTYSHKILEILKYIRYSGRYICPNSLLF